MSTREERIERLCRRILIDAIAAQKERKITVDDIVRFIESRGNHHGSRGVITANE